MHALEVTTVQNTTLYVHDSVSFLVISRILKWQEHAAGHVFLSMSFVLIRMGIGLLYIKE